MYSSALAEGRGRRQNLEEALKVLSKSCKYGDEDPACSAAKKLEQSILESKKSKKK
jgi:TPR repeat protein